MHQRFSSNGLLVAARVLHVLTTSVKLHSYTKLNIFNSPLLFIDDNDNDDDDDDDNKNVDEIFKLTTSLISLICHSGNSFLSPFLFLNS